MPIAAILVEDNEEIRKSLISALAEVADVQVIATAETAEQGIATLNVHADTWRLTVVDMFLKTGNGLQVLRAGRVRNSDQRMVVLTNYATPDMRRKATECGADAVFDKSTEIEQFLELCKRYAAEESRQVANASAAPPPRENQVAALDPLHRSGIEELIERVAVDRLLTDAVLQSVERNVAAVRDHLQRQGSGRRASPGSSAAEPQAKPNDNGGSTSKNECDDE